MATINPEIICQLDLTGDAQDYNKKLYLKEIAALKRKASKPLKEAYTSTLWEQFLWLSYRIYQNKLYDHLKGDLFYLAEKIIFRDKSSAMAKGTSRWPKMKAH